jgi:hypothetical protein
MVKAVRHFIIREIRDDGSIVEMDDGSLWKSVPGDAGKILLWQPGQHITLVESAKSIQPDRMINIDTRDRDIVAVSQLVNS